MNPDNYPPKPIHSKRMVSAGAILLILIVLGFGVWLIRRGADTVVGSQSSQSQFQNWLKPASEIKVGDYRYASSCQLLPKNTVEAAFGTLASTTVVQEKYLDQTVAQASTGGERLSCIYNPVLGSGPQVQLETAQFSDRNDARRISTSLGSFEDAEVQTELDAYNKALADKPNKTAKQFLQTLEQSFAKYKQFDPANPDTLDINGMILPVSDSVTGALTDFDFVGAYSNVTYSLGHSPANRKGKNTVTAYSSQELVNELLAMKKANDAVMHNLQNKSLNQSPAPTILGKTDKYGSTTILESCAILTADAFNKISGRTQNYPVDRTTAPINFTTKRYTKQDHKLVLPANDCSRQSTTVAADGVSRTSTYATLTMQYGSSTDQAKQWLADGYKVEARDTTLQTNADWAVSFVNPLKPDTYDPVVVFRVGPYIGTINLYTRNPDDSEVIATQDQYIAAINTLTASLKQNINNIQTN